MSNSERLSLKKNITDTLENKLNNKLIQNDFYREIIECKTFKRLKHIRFLGAIDYLYKNKKKHTRYEHTLSVARLAVRYSELTKLKYNDEKYLVVAALLHDIGHGPLSHSMEPSFKKLFGLTHHLAGTNIILGKSPLGDEVFKILNKYNIKVDKLIKLLDGKSNEKYAFALNNPINIDTIDGIIRSYSYLFSARNKNTKMSTVPDVYDILEATIDVKKQRYLDSFWKLKNKVYNDLINKEIHIYADNYSQRFVLKKKQHIKEEDFYLSEIEFKNKYKSLFENLAKLSEIKQNEKNLELRYIKRLYKINKEEKIIDATKLNTKYTYTKKNSILKLKQNIQGTQKTLYQGI